MTTVINSYCEFHLGDNIINFIFFYKIKDYIESNDIIINYHCNKSYHSNLMDFKCSDNIIILPIDKIGYHLWQGTELPFGDNYIENVLCTMFNKFLSLIIFQ